MTEQSTKDITEIRDRVLTLEILRAEEGKRLDRFEAEFRGAWGRMEDLIKQLGSELKNDVRCLRDESNTARGAAAASRRAIAYSQWIAAAAFSVLGFVLAHYWRWL